MLFETTADGRLRLISYSVFPETKQRRNAKHPVTRWRRARRLKITGRSLKRERGKLRLMLEKVRRAEARTGRRQVPKRVITKLREAANFTADNVALLEGTLETLREAA